MAITTSKLPPRFALPFGRHELPAMDTDSTVDSFRTAIPALCPDVPLSVHIWMDWMAIGTFSASPGEKYAHSFA
jgi:hypothetical protein